MKKLFFAAALAIVAVGGALTSTAQIYEPGTSNEIDCIDTSLATCPFNFAVEQADTDEPLIDVSEWTYTGF